MDVNGLVDKINAWYPIVVSVGGAILVIVLAYRGYQWGTASDPQEEKQAQKGVKCRYWWWYYDSCCCYLGFHQINVWRLASVCRTSS